MTDSSAVMLDRLFTSTKAPIRYLPIQKSGCTYIKNFIWQVDTGGPHPSPMRIHDADESFQRVSDLGYSLDDVVREGMAFTALRDPIDRFLSLYRDKIIGEGYLRFDPLRKILEEKYGLNPHPATADDHYTNCRILISWINVNIQSEIDLKKNPHWTPQSYRKNILSALKMRILLVDDLTLHLGCMFRNYIENLDELLDGTERNRSSAGINMRDIVDKDLRRKINKVYARDRWMYRNAQEAWAGVDPTTADAINVPRFDLSWLTK